MSSYGYNNCYAQCPSSTVTIQPPPFVLNIPGPALYCPNEAFRIEQYNPCAYGGIGSGRYSTLMGSEFSEFGPSYNLPAISNRSYSYRRY